eukprot:46980_1
MLPKYVEAERLIANNEWNTKFKDESECFLKVALESGAYDAFSTDTPVSKREQVLNMNGMALVAFDTTANTISNMVYTMWKHPKETQIVRDAIKKHSELSNINSVFSLDMLKGCNELENFVHEMNRVYGIVPFFNRVVFDENGLDFGGYLLPKGTLIKIPVTWLHQGEGSWSDAQIFNPLRFDKSLGNKEERGDIGRYNSIPFATGLHKCLGIHLSLLEMRIYAALLIRDWE